MRTKDYKPDFKPKKRKRMRSWRGCVLVKELLEGRLYPGLADWQIDLLGDVFKTRRFTIKQLNDIEAMHKEAEKKGLLRSG